MAYVITAEELERVINTTEPKETGLELKAGDFVIFPKHATGYREAHVESLAGNGKTFTVTYGSKNLSRSLRFGMCIPDNIHYIDEISEIWRKRRVRVDEQYTKWGVTQHIVSSEIQWYLVWKDEDRSEVVSFWAE